LRKRLAVETARDAYPLRTLTIKCAGSVESLSARKITTNTVLNRLWD
jgi:hypothetical protein